MAVTARPGQVDCNRRERYMLASMGFRRLARFVLCISVSFNGNGIAWAQVIGAMPVGTTSHAEIEQITTIVGDGGHADHASGHGGHSGQGKHAPGTDCCDGTHCGCGCVVPPALIAPLVSLPRPILTQWVPIPLATPSAQFVPQHLLRPPAA